MNIPMLPALAISATVIGIAFWIVPTNSEVDGGGKHLYIHTSEIKERIDYSRGGEHI